MKLSRFIMTAGLSFILLDTAAQAKTTLDLVKPLLLENCSTCHNESLKKGGLDVNDDEQVLASIDLIIQVVASGAMPVGQPEFKDSEDGLMLLEGLEGLRSELEN